MSWVIPSTMVLQSMIKVATLQTTTIIMNSLEASLQNMLLRHSKFYKSHERGNMITRNLEHLLTPQPSVPHRTAQERTEYIAQKGLLLLQIHTKTTFQPRVTQPPKSQCSHLSCPYLIQSHNQSLQQKPSVAQQFSHLSVPPQSTSITVPSSTTPSVTFWELPVFLPQSIIGGLSRQQHLYSYFFVVSKDILNKQILTSTE